MKYYECDKLEISEEYKKVSLEELRAEKERLFENMKGQDKGDLKTKLSRSSVRFPLLEKYYQLHRPRSGYIRSGLLKMEMIIDPVHCQKQAF